MLLFDGCHTSHGTYGVELRDDGGGKMKGKATTLKQDVTVEMWIQHLTGKRGLGIIPINDQSQVRFAAIDIDVYPLNLAELNQRIQSMNMPLTLCRTKSGGAHLYLFLEEFHDAAEVQAKMREMASMLGYGNAEIFPKQTQIMADRGDAGSWINMPYLDCSRTSRYALGLNNEQLGIAKFIEHSFKKMVPYERLRSLGENMEDPLPEGPPCLNHLIQIGFPAGTRNTGLFNLAVYAKKRYGDDWPTHIQEYNGKYMKPPLDAAEVKGLTKSIEKKDFNYTCKQVPMCNYCNMPKCRNKKFGIGMGDTGMPKLGSLTKLKTSPPIWFIEIEGGGRMELTTDELQNPRGFQNKCMEILNIMPLVPKASEWQEIVHKLLIEANEIEVPVDLTLDGQLWSLLEDFLTSRVQGKIIDDLLLGKPWLHDGVYYFRARDFFGFVDRQKWRLLEQQQMVKYFDSWKFGRKFWNVRGKGINCLTVDAKRFERQETPFEVPTIVAPDKVL
jgi:hypothetical protein